MSEIKEEVAAEATKAPVTELKAKQYIAKETCFYNGRYLARGQIILLDKKPDHACLVPYSGKKQESDTAYFDPIQENIEKDRIASAMTFLS